MGINLTDAIKRAAIDAMENNQPTDLRYGTVISVEPLQIQVTSSLILPSSLLVVPEHLTDYEVPVSILSDYGWVTQKREGGSGFPEFASHDHDILINELKLKVHGRLNIGDKVALLRKQGGQSYFVLDRVPK